MTSFLGHSQAPRAGATRLGAVATFQLCYAYESAPDVPIVQRPRTRPFQGRDPGSNPGGDATISNILRTTLRT